MTCFNCKKQVDELTAVITAPDGDVFHPECIKSYEEEKKHFLDVTIKNDDKFSKYMGVPKKWIL